MSKLEAIDSIFARALKTTQLVGNPTVFSKVGNARERAIEAYAKQLFLDEGVALASVTAFKKAPIEEVEVQTYYEWRHSWAKKLGLKSFLRTKKEVFHALSCQLELDGKFITISVDEKKFCRFGRKPDKNTWFFVVREDYLQRPVGFEGIKSIWDYILIEFKKIMPQLKIIPRRV